MGSEDNQFAAPAEPVLPHAGQASSASEDDSSFVEFELLEHDYIAAYSMAAPLRQRVLVFVFLILFLFNAYQYYVSREFSDLSLALIFLAYIAVIQISLRRGIKRFYRQLNERDRKVTYSIQGTELKIETERSMILLDSEDIQKHKESSAYLLLYKTSAFFYVIPKDRMPEQWITKIKDILQLSE